MEFIKQLIGENAEIITIICMASVIIKQILEHDPVKFKKEYDEFSKNGRNFYS